MMSVLAYIKSLGIQPLKKFGQNFLINTSLITKIVSSAKDLENLNVIEVGPGPGILTREIVQHAPKSLTLIEYDSRIAPALQQFKDANIIFEDVLKVDFPQLALPPCCIISNLPYNISVELLYKLMPHFKLFEYFIFMFQKEVANRIKALPNTKEYGKLSVLMQTLSTVEEIAEVHPGSFYPAPSILSTVLRITPKENNLSNISGFNNFLTILFENRRKKLKKKLSGIINIDDDFIKSKYDLRAEDLTPEEYMKLFEYIKKW